MTTFLGSIGHTARKATLTAGLALAVALGALASGTLFSACALRHATRAPGTPPPAAIFRYDCKAKVIANDGVLHTITLPRPDLVGRWTCSGPVADPDNSANVAAVREQMRRYLARALPGCTGSDCTDSYGPGPWCVVPDDANDVQPHRESNALVAQMANPNEPGDALPVCSPAAGATAICNDPDARLAIAAEADPDGPNFGAVAVGGMSRAHTFEVLNSGTGVVCLRSAYVTAGTGDIWHAGSDCAPNSGETAATGYTMLGSGYRTQCTVNVSFWPTAAGIQGTNLVAESSRMTDTVTRPLTGIGRGLSAGPNPQCFNVDEIMDPGRECRWFNRVVVTNNVARVVQITGAEVLPGDRTLPDGRLAWLDGVSFVRRPGSADVAVPTPTVAAPLGLDPGSSLVHILRACQATGLPAGTLRIQSDEAAGDLDVTLLPPDGCAHVDRTP